MYYQGDKVSYTGEKFRSDLGGKMGEICARVGGYQGEVYVVDFGGDDYIMPVKSLATFQGHLKMEGEEHKKDNKKSKTPHVEHRRRNQTQEETE